MSMTSREVAEILSKAAPMAPLSDEEEEELYVNEDAEECDDDEFYYCNGDDVEDDAVIHRDDVYHRHSIDDGIRLNGNVTYSGNNQLDTWQQKVGASAAVNRAMSLDAMARMTGAGFAGNGLSYGSLGRHQLEASKVTSGGWQQQQQPGNVDKAGRERDPATFGYSNGRAVGSDVVNSHADGFRRADNRLAAPAADLFHLVRSCRLVAVRLESSNRDNARHQGDLAPPFQARNCTIISSHGIWIETHSELNTNDASLFRLFDAPRFKRSLLHICEV
jgi:hypothetical protein